MEFPCVGDFVLLKPNDSGVSRITQLLPRHSKFSRADLSGHAAGYAKTVLEQVVAANFETVFILSSLNYDFNLSRIQRYLTQARQSGADPVVVLTKADLADDIETPVAEVLSIAPDVPVHAVSSRTSYGLDALAPYLQPGKTVVFLGMSGVGKSSLLNTLMGQTVMEVKTIREDDSRGRHTTTHRQLFQLPSGAMIIDTPGMRELGLFEAQDGINAGFADVEALFGTLPLQRLPPRKRARLCGEGCPRRWLAVPRALGKLQSQQRELRFINSKAAYLINKRAWGKSIAQWNKQQQKEEIE